MNFKLIPLLLISFLLSSCASIINEDTTQVSLETSTGEKADVVIGGMTYSIPSKVKLKRSREDLEIISKNKNCDEKTKVGPELSPVFFLNIIAGGGLGSTTDFASSNMWDYSKKIVIKCKKQ